MRKEKQKGERKVEVEGRSAGKRAKRREKSHCNQVFSVSGRNHYGYEAPTIIRDLVWPRNLVTVYSNKNITLGVVLLITLVANV